MIVEIALLCGADSQLCKRGPSVRLPKGIWAVRVTGAVSSTIRVNANGSSAEVNGEHKITLKDNHEVFVEFAKRGNDRSVNVKAVWLRGLDDA
jgi:hypothetical protein